MRRRRGMIAAGTAAFLLVLIVRFPARWAALALPHGIACGELAGTVWSGSCAELTAAGTRLGELTWRLHPLPLLAGRLDLEAALTRSGAAGRARVQRSPAGTLTARDLHAAFALDRGLIPELPAGLRGAAAVDLASLEWNGTRVTAIRGQIEVRDLTAGTGEPLGSYRLSFAGGSSGEPTGTLTDLGGPFALQATVRLTREPGYLIEGLIAARPGAPPDLASELAYLGAADAEGRRPLSIAGTF